MTGDRRKPDDRRGHNGAVDRRNSNDRRYAASRRGAEAGVDEPAKKGRRKSGKESGKSSGKKGIDWNRFFKRVAIAFMMIVGFFTAGVIYFFSHLDYYVNKLGQRINIELEKVTLDPESLTDRTTLARINLKVKNTLPLDVVLMNLNLNVHLSGYTMAKGTQSMPKAVIKGNIATIVPVTCNVDSIMARRGLQKAMESNSAALVKSLANRLQGRKDKISDNLKSFVKVDGSAEFRLIAAGVEVPFSKQFAFDQK